MKGLRWWRRARGLTQAELAEASGVERSHIGRLERGEVDEPRPDTLLRLAEALGVTVIDLLYGERSVEIFGAPEELVRRGPDPAPQLHRYFTDTSPLNGQNTHETPANRPLGTRTS